MDISWWDLWIVSLPRSLSSCTMRQAAAAGLVPFTDGEPSHLPHQANPHGFYEHSHLNMRPVETMTGVDGTGRVAKVFARNVKPLLDARIRPRKAILLRRPIEQIIASWDANFPALKRTADDLVEKLAEAHAVLLADGVPVLELDFHVAVREPRRTCKRIAWHLDLPESAAATMAEIPDRELVHYGGA